MMRQEEIAQKYRELGGKWKDVDLHAVYGKQLADLDRLAASQLLLMVSATGV
jgi:hypothetical protein